MHPHFQIAVEGTDIARAGVESATAGPGIEVPEVAGAAIGAGGDSGSSSRSQSRDRRQGHKQIA